MKRLIDADEIEWYDHFDSDGNKTKYKVAYSDEMPPTIDAIPIEWLIRMRNKHNNDGFAWIYEAVMDDWREEHAETD